MSTRPSRPMTTEHSQLPYPQEIEILAIIAKGEVDSLLQIEARYRQKTGVFLSYGGIYGRAKRLEARGWIALTAHPTSQRNWAIEITSKGLEAMRNSAVQYHYLSMLCDDVIAHTDGGAKVTRINKATRVKPRKSAKG